jgi:hypothetical protein
MFCVRVMHCLLFFVEDKKMFLLVRRLSLHIGSRYASTSTLTHITPDGNISMVDIGEKASSARRAIAEAVVRFPDRASYQSYFHVTSKKGDARLCAKLAGILAAKVIAFLSR